MDNLQDNIGGTKSSGIDFALAYDHQRPYGRFRHSLEGTWLHEYPNVYPGFDVKGKGNYDISPFPELRANISTLWALKDYSAGVDLRYINAFKECENGDCSVKDGMEPLSRKIDLNVTADLFFGYTVKAKTGTTSLSVGVNNLTDTNPPLIYAGFLANSDASLYDFMGSYFYTRLTHTF